MGVVKDQSGEPLPGAVVYVKSKPASGTSTDAYGNFILKIFRKVSKSSLSVVWVWSPKNLLSPDKNLR